MGDKITYSTADTIKKLKSQGYELIEDGFTNKAGNVLSNSNNRKTFIVRMKKSAVTKSIDSNVKTTTPEKAQPVKVANKAKLNTAVPKTATGMTVANADVKYAPGKKQAQLPQTGNETNKAGILAGTGVIAGAITYLGLRRKKHN